MQNSSEQSQPYNDEIDLADLVRSLWQGKWLVIGVTFSALVLAVAYLTWAPKSYTASLKISALPAAQADAYTELNATELMTIDEQVLLSLFVEDLKTQSDNALGLSMVAANPTQWVLGFPTQAPGQLTQTLADALELTNKNVNQQLVRNFSQRSDELVRKNSLTIESLDLERQQQIALFRANNNRRIAILEEQTQLARTRYDASVREKIARLNEQALISRSLKLDKIDISVTKGADTGKNPYLRGYVALEKEIKVLKARKSVSSFIADLAEIELQISQLKSQNPEVFIPDLTRIELLKSDLIKNRVVNNAEKLRANTPIGTDQFAAVTYNLDSIAYKNNTKTSLILALALVLGGMLGIFVLLIRNVLINKD